MKRYIAFLLTLLTVFGLIGCTDSSSEDFIYPVSFYYCANLDTTDNFNDIYVQEIHEGSPYINDRTGLLTQYLNGPYSENSENPFPAGLTLISIEQIGSTVHITLSEHISRLDGLDLTLACACLSMTLFDLCSCDCVEIRANGSLLAGSESVTITKDDLVLTDAVISVPTD